MRKLLVTVATIGVGFGAALILVLDKATHPPPTAELAHRSATQQPIDPANLALAHRPLEAYRTRFTWSPRLPMNQACIDLQKASHIQSRLRLLLAEVQSRQCLIHVKVWEYADWDPATHVGSLFIQLRSDGEGFLSRVRIKVNINPLVAESAALQTLIPVLSDLSSVGGFAFSQSIFSPASFQDEMSIEHQDATLTFRKERIGDNRYNLIMKFPHPEGILSTRRWLPVDPDGN